jgi:hypothetical protein
MMGLFSRSGFRRGGNYRVVLVVQVALLAVLLLATFILHLSGTALVELRVARLVILVALVVGAGWVSRRRRQLDPPVEHDQLQNR